MENEETTPLILSDWVEIQSEFSSDDENPVIINQYFFDDSAVFPPSNHEDLPIDSLNQEDQVVEEEEEEEEEQSQVFISSPAGGNGVVAEGGVENNAGKRMRRDTLFPGCLSSAIGKFLSGMTKCAAFRPSIWWFGTATTGVGALALVVVLSRRAKRWRKKVMPPAAADSNQYLMFLIQSKDQKINQLLLQVSHLNEMLLARRRVPVLHVG